MSPRPLDPRTRPELIDVAARLLAQEGPQSLSSRRIATETGSSTMTVYTHFGSMSELVRAIVHEGFSRLQRYLTSVRPTDDAVADIALLGRVYRSSALANPHLYTVMFGGASLANFSLTEEDRQYGRYTLLNVVSYAERCIAARRFRPADAELVAHLMWTAVHGIVTLELGGYLISPCDADRCFEAQLVGLMVGAGDTLDAATESMALSGDRFAGMSRPPG
jgi:AcrR family transcriptional regulator